MAAQKIQIADKPTLDEVAVDVEALKAELASMSELVTTIGKKVGVVELEATDTMTVIGGSGKAPIAISVSSGSTYSYQGKGTFFIEGTSSSFMDTLVIDGVNMSINNNRASQLKISESAYRVPFNKSISFSTNVSARASIIFD